MRIVDYVREDVPGRTTTQFEADKKVGMTVYIPDPIHDGSGRRPAMLVLPGGGYQFCSVTEAEPIALSFASKGYLTAVLYYRTQGFEARQRTPEGLYPQVVHDVYWAMTTLREHAGDWAFDASSLGIIGFSAGAHLAALATYGYRDPALSEGFDPDVIAPNFAILGYPVILSQGPFIHNGSIVNLLGTNAGSHTLIEQVDPTRYIREDSAPTFIWHTADDDAVPVQNTLTLATALTTSGVTTEVHIYPHGPHGLTLAIPYVEQRMPEVAVWLEQAIAFANRFTDYAPEP